jgi:hypothetical protein
MAAKNVDKIYEKIAWGVEGLVIHSNGMKKEFKKKSDFLIPHCET